MIDIIDMLHYLIGFIILGLLIWFIILTHNYFSKDNKSIEELINSAKLTNNFYKLTNNFIN